MKPIFYLLSLAVLVSAELEQTEVEELFHNASSKFSANMFTEVAKNNPDKSFVISPFSVLTPLAQLSIASREKTREQLWNVIGINSDESVKQAFTYVNAKINAVKGVTLKTASKIYVAQNYDLYEDFGDVTWKVFGGAAQNIDFTKSTEAANEINAWVEQNTNNRIKDLVNPDNLNGDTRALLVNAIYFKGSWENEFQKLATREQDFHINNAETKKVQMMFRRGDYKYATSAILNSQILEIPYKGGETSLVVILPREIEGIKNVQEILSNPEILDYALTNLRKQEVDLYLPKFKVETTTDLKDILTKLNVTDVFDPYLARIDYLIRVKGNLYVNSAVQKAFIEVNEEGAEAAASNVFGIQPMSLSREFIVNRPFYYAIRFNSLTLFEGISYA